MDVAAPVLPATIPINKEYLFSVLLRLYQMINDAEFLSGTPDDASPETDDSEGSDSGDVVDESAVDVTDDLVNVEPPPNHFMTLFEANVSFALGICDEYILLFNILCTPLDADPALKEEFTAYAHKNGEPEFEFISQSVEFRRAKLTLVPPLKKDPEDVDPLTPKK